MPLLVDTGVIYALADRRDAWHRKVREYVRERGEPMLAPVTILPEVAYLLRDRIGAPAERAFARSVAHGEIAIEHLIQSDVGRAVDLMAKYEWLGLVDATVVAMAERLKIAIIATTDRRPFGEVRPIHVEQFTLVP